MSHLPADGSLGDQVLTRTVARETFVEAQVREVVIDGQVEYNLSRLGGGPTHTAPVAQYKRWEREGTRDVRKVGVTQQPLLRLYVKPLSESMLIRMPPREIVSFGEFRSIKGRFELTEDTVDVRVDSDTVEIAGHGTFERATNISKTLSYPESLQGRRNVFDPAYECGKGADDTLREAWARSNDLYASVWRVELVDDPAYSDQAQLTVSSETVSESLRFSVSVDDWEENESARKFVETDGGGLVSNLEGERVVVSLADFSWADPIDETHGWHLYRFADRPSVTNRLKGLFS